MLTLFKTGNVSTACRSPETIPRPNAPMISDIPAFDLDHAYDLYAALLKPTEANWRPAKNLIVVTTARLVYCRCHCCPPSPPALIPTTTRCFPATGKYQGWRE